MNQFLMLFAVAMEVEGTDAGPMYGTPSTRSMNGEARVSRRDHVPSAWGKN